jgi:hypothetical protein
MIAILSNIDTPRLRYALEFLLEGFSFDLFNEGSTIPQEAKILTYGLESKHALFCLPSMEFPWWKDGNYDLIGYRKAVTTLHSFGDFDLLAYSFYLLARCDEYFPENFDQLGRFQSSGCIQVQWSGVSVAYLDEWRAQLIGALGLSEVRIPKRQLTVDIDSPFAFQYKSPIKQFAGFFRDVIQYKWDWVSRRIQVALGGDDPYNTYSDIQLYCSKVQFDLIYFVLCAKRGEWDRGMELEQKMGWETLFSLIKNEPWGWHPSVQGHQDDSLFFEELNRLEKAKGEKIRASRFHYLKQSMPQSPRRLLALGIEFDYTMGFADAVGYRAGTSRSFPWFDWENGCATTLVMVPFWGMDVTLKKYLQLTPAIACEKVLEAKQYAAVNQCDWRMIWHNESVNDWSEWKGWRIVFEQFLKR